MELERIDHRSRYRSKISTVRAHCDGQFRPPTPAGHADSLSVAKITGAQYQNDADRFLKGKTDIKIKLYELSEEFKDKATIKERKVELENIIKQYKKDLDGAEQKTNHQVQS